MITGLGRGIDGSLLDQLLTVYHNKHVWNVCAIHRLSALLSICWLASHLSANSVSVLMAVER